MVLRFGATKGDDVATLIAKKNYSKAIEVIKTQLKSGRPDSRVRMQLGDVLILAGRDKEAVQVLLPVADEYAQDGFAAKAVAVLKKIQRLDPGRRDIETRLAQLIQQKQNQASSLPLTQPGAPAGGGFAEIGMEEIGFDAFSGGGGISVPAELTPAPVPPYVPMPEPPAPAPEPPVFEAPAPRVAPPAVKARAQSPAPPAAPSDDLFSLPDVNVAGDLPILELEVPAPAPLAGRPVASELLDQDLFTDDPDLFLLDEEQQQGLEAVPEADDDDGANDPMTDGLFASELLSLVEDAFQALPTAADGSLAPPTGDFESSPGGHQIVISPLFKDFAVDEMVAVIQGLKLLTFEPRQVILREGAAGNSMYMLTAGTAKAYVKNAQGKQALVGELNEGAFFGEISMLTGKPRSATVVAAERCELLELDRATLDGITRTHPHVREVMEQFARERLARRG